MPDRPRTLPAEAMQAIDREVAAAHNAARVAMVHADAARQLAGRLRIRRHAMVQRAERPIATHVEATWTSAAASASRTELRHDVGFALWAAGEHIERTEMALLDRAERFETEARAHTRAASEAEFRRGEAMVAAFAGERLVRLESPGAPGDRPTSVF